MTTTIQAALQHDRKKQPDVLRFRTLTRDEVFALRSGDVRLCLLNSGRVGSVKINGAVRTWKRDRNRVEVPVKYGMYEYAVFDLTAALEKLLVQVE